MINFNSLDQCSLGRILISFFNRLSKNGLSKLEINHNNKDYIVYVMYKDSQANRVFKKYLGAEEDFEYPSAEELDKYANLV